MVNNAQLYKRTKNEVSKIYSNFSDVFEDSLGHTDVATHRIDTGSSAPISVTYMKEADDRFRKC